MGNLSIIENIIDKKLTAMHTAFLAKVITAKGTKADIQPLQTNAPILPNTPIAQNARNKISTKTISVLTGGNNGCKATGKSVAEGENLNLNVSCSCTSQNITVPVLTPIQAGDIVICLCSDQNISTAKKGKMPTSSEPEQRFSLSNSIIVGIL